MSRQERLVGTAILAMTILGACTGNASGEPTKAQQQLRTAVLKAGNINVIAELARTPAEQTAGLMFRTSLPDGRGMLFIYDQDQRLSFWMKNTLIPLSIAFLSADGTILEIHDLQPRSLAAVQSLRSVRHALEVPQGWFGRAGLAVGDRFELPPEISGR
jgi:hypothetical protein